MPQASSSEGERLREGMVRREDSGRRAALENELRPASELPEVVYTPQSELSNPLKMLGAMLADVKNGRELAWRLFLRNLKAQYRQTFLGFLWVVLPPVTTTLLWVVLQSQKVVNFAAPDGVPYVLYVLAGTILWNAFTGCLNAPMSAMAGGREMLGKLRFPREALLMSALGQVIFNLLLQLVILAGVILFYGYSLPPTAVFFPVAVAALMLLGLGLGLVITPVGLLYKDVGRAIGLFSRFWMYLTPVIYAPWTGSKLATAINWCNPVAPVLVATRDFLLVGHTDFMAGFVIYSTAGAAVTVAGMIALRLAMPIIIERA